MLDILSGIYPLLAFIVACLGCPSSYNHLRAIIRYSIFGPFVVWLCYGLGFCHVEMFGLVVF